MLKQYKILFLFLLGVFSFAFTKAQTNLVPNFAFENYTTCPNSGDQAAYSIGWSKYSNTISTPDYFNACSSSSTFGVPQSATTYQPDHRNCRAYMGLVTWVYSIVNYREHVGIQLSQPLIVGQKYYLSFYTVMGNGYFSGDYFNTPTNNIGLRFSTISYNSANPMPTDNFSHLRSVTVITDTVNWVRISGSIVADSAYNYLILGNFYTDANTDTTTQTCGTCQNYSGYYLIDDVCVSTDSSLCNGGIDVLPCAVSIEENSFDNQFKIYPNPANDHVYISYNNNHYLFNLTIYNSIGQVLYSEQKIFSENLQIDISNYSDGLLFIKIESNNNQFISKLLKQ